MAQVISDVWLHILGMLLDVVLRPVLHMNIAVRRATMVPRQVAHRVARSVHRYVVFRQHLQLGQLLNQGVVFLLEPRVQILLEITA